MSTGNENSKLLEQYQKILKMCTEHMKKCPKFEKQVIEGFEFQDE